MKPRRFLRPARQVAKWVQHRLIPIRKLASRVLPLDVAAVALGRTPRPKGWIKVADYFSGQCADDRWISLYPPETIRYKPLPDLGQELPDFLRCPKDETVPEAGVAILNGCRYWGHYGGTVVSSSELVLEEFSREVFGIEHNRIFHTIGLPKPTTLAGTTAVLTCRDADTNYYHWTVDLLPRIHLLLMHFGTLSSIDWFLINHADSLYQLETLSELGIPHNKIITPNSSTHYILEEAYVPTLKEPKGPVTSWALGFLASLQTDNLEARSKIYVSRRTNAGRTVINEDELHDCLHKLGFQRLYLEDYSVRHQRFLFQNAQQIVAIHGAGLANLASCAPGTSLVEIFPPSYLGMGFRRIATVKDLNHCVVLGRGHVAAKPNDVTKKSDYIEVPVEIVLRALDSGSH